jgi:hypothetical protein
VGELKALIVLLYLRRVWRGYREGVLSEKLLFVEHVLPHALVEVVNIVFAAAPALKFFG